MAQKPEPTYPITVEWQRKVAERLAPRGARAALARQIGCSAPTITQLLSPDARHSHLIPRIHRAFGWPPPAPPVPVAQTEDERALAEFERLYEQLTEEQREVVMATARALAAKR